MSAGLGGCTPTCTDIHFTRDFTDATLVSEDTDEDDEDDEGDEDRMIKVI